MSNHTKQPNRDQMDAVVTAAMLDTRFFEKHPGKVQRIRFPFPGEFYPFGGDPPRGAMILVRMSRGGQWEREVIFRDGQQ